MANTIEIVGELKRQWEGGETLGPRAVLAGMLDGPGPYAGPTKALVSSFEEARPWIDRYAALGYVQVKLYSSIKPELVAPIAAYAHSKGMRVSGHIPAFMTAEQAIRAGYDEIQHANMLVLNFLFDEVKDTRTPARFTAVAEHAASMDLDSAPARAFFDLLAERGIVLDPTLSIFEGMFTAVPGEVSPDFAAVADRLPPLVRRGFLGGGLPVPEGGADRYRASFKKMQQIVLEAWKRGIASCPAPTRSPASRSTASWSCTRRRGSRTWTCSPWPPSAPPRSPAAPPSRARSARASSPTSSSWPAPPTAACATSATWTP
jgi:hypothetical protein